MATHFMRILSRMMVPGPARTPSRPDVRAGGGGGSRATPTPLGLTNPPCPHTRLLSCAAGWQRAKGAMVTKWIKRPILQSQLWLCRG